MSGYSKLDITIGRVTPQLGIRQIVALVLICLSASIAFAQVGTGTIQGTILDEVTGEPVQFVEIGVHLDGIQITNTFTNEDGFFRIVALKPRTDYLVIASKSGYRTVHSTKCSLKWGQVTFCDFKLQVGLEHQEPLILTHYSSDTTSTAKPSEPPFRCRGFDGPVMPVPSVSDCHFSTKDTMTFDMLLGTPAMLENK